MIQLNDLSIGYNGTPIMAELNQTYQDGYIYGILAKSGAGKTTLLKTIAGLLKPIHGKVVIDNEVYRNSDKNPVYMMHQRYSNFGWLTCCDNVLIAERNRKFWIRLVLRNMRINGHHSYLAECSSVLLLPEHSMSSRDIS